MRIKSALFCILLSLSISFTHAQTLELDQLVNKADHGTGKERIAAMAELSRYYSSSNPTRGIEYGNMALHLADYLKIPSENGKIYNNLGVNYLMILKPDTAMLYFIKAFAAASQYKDSTQMGIACTGKGLVYERKGVFDSSLIVFHKALNIFQQIHDEERIGKTLENLGTIHIHRGEYKTSLSYLLEAKTSYEKAGSAKNLSSLYVKIGRIYSETAEYASAKKWFEKGKQLLLDNGNYQEAGIAINALGIMYKNQGKYEEALKTYLEVVTIADKIKNKVLLLAVYGNIGNAYQSLGNYTKAIDFHQKALNIAMSLNKPVEIAIQFVNLGNDYNSLKDYRNAIKYLEKALPVFTDSKTQSNLLSTYDAMITATKGLKNYELSVTYYEKYMRLKDSLNENELNTALDSLKVKFNTEQTQQENTLLAQKNEIKDKTISIQRNMIVSAVIIAVLLIGLILMIIRNRQKIRRTNILLEEKNQEISEKAEELNQSNQRLTELSQFKDSMQSFLVHDLKNPLNKLLSINNKGSSGDNIEGVKQTGLQMLNIVSNLLDINKYEEKIMKLVIQSKSLSQIVNEAFGQTRYLAQQKSIQILIDYTIDYILKVDAEIMTRVFVNLLTNAIKFSHAGGKIRISADILDYKSLKLVVKDEGEGISSDYQALIFDKFSQAKVRHLGFAGSTGIGLSFCKIAVESHGGTIGVKSEEGQGSSFWFTLPFLSKLECLPEDLDVFAKEKTTHFKIEFNKEEISYLDSFCSILKSTSIYQISDIKEILNRIEGNTDNIAKWKWLLLRALNDCNEVKYFELINEGTHEPN